MSAFCVFLSAVVYLLVVADTSVATTCSNSVFTASDVNLILSRVNAARTKVRNGEQKNGLTGTNLPIAKSMPDLKWSCPLEQESAAVLEHACNGVNGINSTAPQATNLPILFYMEQTKTHVARMLNQVLDEIDYKNLTQIEGLIVKYNNESDLDTFANVIRENASQIGCTTYLCQHQTFKIQLYFSMCVTDQQIVVPGNTIYHGVPPTTTTESTTTTTTTATTTTTTGYPAVFPTGVNNNCPSNTEMTDELRLKFLNMHNYRRSLLANGKIARKNGKRYPKAANMARMSYDCDLEAQAVSYVKQCPNVKSGSTNVGENYFRISTSGLNTWVDGVNKAVTSWWKVVRESSSGVGVSAVTFRQNHVGTEIESWAQMAWARSNKLGCSIALCHGEYVTVCRYLEKGNVVEHQVYTPGALCSMCASGCNTNGLCL